MMKIVEPQKLNPENWVSNYYGYLFNYARTKVSNHYIVEELIQETFLSGLKSMKNFQNRSTEKTWLTSILKNKIIDHYRKSNTFKGVVERRMLSNDAYEGVSDRDFSDEMFMGGNYLDESHKEDIRKSILDSIEKLPESQSKVFKMRVIDNYETEAICEKLNISPSNAWVLMCRARKTLAIQLRPQLLAV